MLLSRLAENLYWAGRYLERAESTARLVRVQTELYLDLPRSVSVGWRPLLAVTGSDEAYRQVLDADDGRAVATEENRIVTFLTTSPDNTGSVLSSLTAARMNLRPVRALLPRSGWEVANSLHLWATGNADLAVPRRSRLEWLGGIVQRCQTLTGLLGGTMSHDQAYAFLQAGRHLERADMTTRVIDVQASVLLDHRIGAGTLPYADVTWMAVLKSVSAMQMFRRVARAGVSGPRALRFLLTDAEFPRSVEHALQELRRRLVDLPASDASIRACDDALDALHEAEMEGLDGPGLHALVDRLQRAIAAVHTAAQTTWFAPPEVEPAPAAEPEPAPQLAGQAQGQG